MQKQLVELKNKKAVDWKIFEIQSLLISEDADLGTINDSLLWLQPKHYLEVVEERVNDDRCGYPLCTKTILNNKFKKGTYRIDYNNQKVYTIDQSHLYCSNQCIEKSQLLEVRFDVSSPYSRSVVNSLNVDIAQKSSIDDILTLLGPDANANIKNTRNDASISNSLFKGSSVMKEDGEVQLYFHEGVPVVIPNVTVIEADSNDKIIKNTVINNSDSLSTSSKFEIKKNDLIRNSLWKDDGFEASLHCEGLSESVDLDNVKKCNHHHPTKTIVYHTNTNSKDNQSNLSTNTVTSTEPTNVEEILATMNELQQKYKLKKDVIVSVPVVNSTIINEISVQGNTSNRFTNRSLLKSNEINNNNNNKVEKRSHSQTTVRSEGIGSRKGAKSVSWDSDTVTETQLQPQQSSVTTTTTTTADISNKAIKSTKLIPVQFEIKERLNPHVMSEAAMMLKQEVLTTTKRSLDTSSYSSNDVISSFLVDNNHQNTTIPNTTRTTTSSSIEGYIIQPKDSIRVAPITTIKNLSYFPFQQKDNSSSDVDTIEDEIEQLSVTDSITSSSSGIGQMMDNCERNYHLNDDVDDIHHEAIPKSLFYSVWSTMDELFAYAISVFDDDFDTNNIINNIIIDDHQYLDDDNHHVIITSEDDQHLNDDNYMATQPGVDEENGIIKLLIRGILIAEKKFELSNRYLLTNTDRDQYHKCKKKLLSSTHKILRKSFISNVYIPQTASSLSSSGWVLIGILVIDAILKKKKLGPFYGINNKLSNHDILEVGVVSDNVVNIAASHWSDIVDKLVSDTVGKSTLRKDDLRILRSFFETL